MNVKPALYRIANTSAILAVLCILSTATAVMAACVTFRWDPSGPATDGYRLFARKSGQAYNYCQPDWEGAGVTGTLNRLDGKAHSTQKVGQGTEAPATRVDAAVIGWGAFVR
jgi:hypothetical protein